MPLMSQQTFVLDISWTSILKVSLSLFVVYLLYLTESLLILFLFALIVSLLFSPIIDFFEEKRIPRGVSVIVIYGGIFGLFALFAYFSLPVFVFEIQKFSQLFPVYFEKIAPSLKVLGFESFRSMESFISTIQGYLISASSNIFSALAIIFGGVFSTIFIITTGMFLSLERRPVETTLAILTPKKYEKQIMEIWLKARGKVSGWFLSRVLASVFVVLTSYIAFALLGLQFPISLAMLAGILNFIPVAGPILAAVFIFSLPALNNVMLGVFALLAFILVQEIENNIITPILTRRFVGLSPALVLIAFAFGATLWGIWGAILTIPLFAIVLEFIKGFALAKKGESEDAVAVLREESPPPIL